MKYRGKVDWFIGGAMWVGLLVPAYAALTTRAHWMIALPIFFGALLLVACYPQSFETTSTELMICAGFTRRRIAWTSITCVRPTSDSSSSLAMSLDRVLIEYKSTSIMIAPDHQEQFFADVASHCPQLSRRGQDLAITFN